MARADNPEKADSTRALTWEPRVGGGSEALREDETAWDGRVILWATAKAIYSEDRIWPWPIKGTGMMPEASLKISIRSVAVRGIINLF